MASIFLHHVVGDLTVGKPEVVEFPETGTVESAVRAIAECAEGAITVWRAERAGEKKVERFVGMLNSLDLVAFLAGAGDQEKAMRAPVAEVVVPDSKLLKEVDPGTRLIDALEMMKQGVRRLLVRKSLTWRGVSKRFSILYNGKWLKSFKDSTGTTAAATGKPSSSSPLFVDDYKYCCLSREDIIRFLIGCLGALAPLPLSSISSLGTINPHYSHIEVSAPAIEAAHHLPQDPCAVAVVETNPDGTHKIVGEISPYKLWRCDYLSAAWALANISAGHFVMGSEDNDGSNLDSLPNLSMVSPLGDGGASPSSRPRKFSSRSIGFYSSLPSSMTIGGSRSSARRSMYRGRSVPLMCKHTSSLAAVMAQMLSHRATHVWVTEADSEEDVLVGVVSYIDILYAVTKHPMGSVTTPVTTPSTS